MINKFLVISLIIFIKIIQPVQAKQVFNFDVTEIEILNDGNLFKGIKRGTVTTDNGIILTADNFEYDKILNILQAIGNVIVQDTIKNIEIFSENIVYLKNQEIIFGKKGFKAIDGDTYIKGNEFEYKKKLDILNAKGKVEINNKKDDYQIYSSDISYYKRDEKFLTKGETTAIVQSIYDFNSEDVTFLKKEKKLFSSKKSTLFDDQENFYTFQNFEYFLDRKILKGEEIVIISKYKKPKSDKTYFSSGFFNFNNKEFFSKDIKILLHKELFDGERVAKDNANELEKRKINQFKGKNEPRIYGTSSTGDNSKTIINKGIFTTCKKNDNCPPWSMKAKKITHDKIKKNIIYDNAVLNLFDYPVFYFPKFFHPDPSVDRRSGLLQPRLNNSNVVGSSLNIPYYHVISENKDLTIKPTIFDDRIYMFQNEYRQENENSSFIADFAITKGYKSSLANNRNSMSHIFSKFNTDLNLDGFVNSKLDLFLEKVSMDTYLKIFENVLVTDEAFKDDLKDHNVMTSGLKLTLDKDNFNFTSGVTSYENLQESSNNDRYQYIFPYYDFSSTLVSNENGSLNFTSSGNNKLTNTNNLRSIVTNDFNFQSNNIYTKNGFVTNYSVNLKNLNTVAKNDSKFKSSLQSEILNVNQLNLTYPLIREEEKFSNYLTPKISFKINPSDMKDYSTDSKLITTDNAFNINRLGLTDSFESGKSLTLGLDYRKENKDNIDKYFELKFASVLRDTPEYKIPKSSSLQDKTSNIFGSVENKFSEYLTINYNFSLDNNLKNFEHNDIKTELKFQNFESEFRFHETAGKVGSSNYFENETSFNFDKNNSLAFKTRRNRKISLTEYYDLIYEYQNDCLTAALKYRKTYYEDRDAIPKEDLFFSISLFPLATLEQKIDKKLYRDDNNDIIWK